MATTTGPIAEVYAEATVIVRRALEAGLSEPARTRAISELEARVRRCLKTPEPDTGAVSDTTHCLLIGSIHNWGDKEVLRLRAQGSKREADVLLGELVIMKETLLPKRLPGMTALEAGSVRSLEFVGGEATQAERDREAFWKRLRAIDPTLAFDFDSIASSLMGDALEYGFAKGALGEVVSEATPDLNALVEIARALARRCQTFCELAEARA